jgi:hypothetical protein
MVLFCPKGERKMDSAKFDRIIALIVFLNDYHSGQWSRGYRLLSLLLRRYFPVKIADGDWERIRASEEYAHWMKFALVV